MHFTHRSSFPAFLVAAVVAPALASADVTMVSAFRIGGAPSSTAFGPYVGHSSSNGYEVDHVSDITTGGVSFNLHAYSPAGSSGAGLSYTFAVDTATPYSIVGSLMNAGPGTPSQGLSTWHLTGPGVNVNAPGGWYINVPFNVTGTLQPGQYTFTVDSDAIAGFMQSHYWPVGTSIQGTLTLGIPSPASAPLLALGAASALRRRRR